VGERRGWEERDTPPLVFRSRFYPPTSLLPLSLSLSLSLTSPTTHCPPIPCLPGPQRGSLPRRRRLGHPHRPHPAYGPKASRPLPSNALASCYMQKERDGDGEREGERGRGEMGGEAEHPVVNGCMCCLRLRYWDGTAASYRLFTTARNKTRLLPTDDIYIYIYPSLHVENPSYAR
jgi:hypothetical protein